jgi:hypothetical protein
MIGKILRTIFLPKETRAKLEKRSRAAARRAPDGQPKVAKGREAILDEAMAIYRKQQRDVYEKLDEETRQQIEADAAKAFGDAIKHKN